jgi:hypothetical protein
VYRSVRTLGAESAGMSGAPSNVGPKTKSAVDLEERSMQNRQFPGFETPAVFFLAPIKHRPFASDSAR